MTAARTAEPARMSYEEFLRMDDEPGLHYEWHDGFVRAMTRAKPEHERIGIRVAVLLDRLAGDECEAFGANMPIFVESEQLHTYADAVLVCGPLVMRTVLDKNLKSVGDALTNPTLIVETLSKSTARYDKGDKFEQYKQLRSFREYILVSQDERHVEVRTRGEDGAWTTQTGGPEATVRVHGHDVAVASFYDRRA